MKRIVLLLAVTTLMAALSANLLLPRYLDRVWFDDAEYFHVLFGPEAVWDGFDVTDLTFTTTAGTYSLPPTYVPPGDTVFAVNLSQEIPGFTVQRNQDFLHVEGPAPVSVELFSWGPQNDDSVHMHALGPGQSAVHIRASGCVDGTSVIYYAWVKDSSITGPPYTPTEDYILSVHLEDGDGNPAVNVPVYINYPVPASPNQQPFGQTGVDGTWFEPFWALRIYILVNDPFTENPLIQQLLFPEPGEPIQINAVVGSTGASDPGLIPSAGVLSLRPSLLNSSVGFSLALKYESPLALGSGAVLRLFDLRGRLLAIREMPSSGETDWDMSGLGSGVYFISLTRRDGLVARGRITVLK